MPLCEIKSVCLIMGELYKLDFASGKSYIGITEKTAAQRFKGHQTSFRLGATALVYRAWRKYGEPKLTVLAVLEDCELSPSEIRAIAIFKTISPHGYNLSEGGHLAPSKHPEVAAKISKSQLGNKSFAGRKHSEETKAKMRASNHHTSGMLGKKWSEEARAKIVAALTGQKRPTTTGDLNPAKREDVRKKISAGTKGNKGRAGQTLTEEHKKRISAALRKFHDSKSH